MAIQHSIFSVYDTPYCVWGWDLDARNIDFIESIDEKYFQYICETHLEHIDGENAQRAAIAVRVNYHLALETLFSFIAATFQAPDCVPAWVLRASTSQVRLLISNLRRGKINFHVKLKARTGFDGFEWLSDIIIAHTPWKSPDETGAKFVTLLHRLSDDFLDEYATKEYNSIKHGFRARAGGFHMSMGIEHQYGIPPPADEVKHLGGSRFGSSFYSAESIDGPNPIKNDPNFRLRRNAVNWFPDMTAGRMWLTALMIKNIKGLLLALNGRQAGQIQFLRPEDPAGFDAPWEKSPGITSSNMDAVISEVDIVRKTRQELRDLLSRDDVSSAG